MGLLNFPNSKGARYTVLRAMVWADGVARVGEVVKIEDPALARGLRAAGKIEPLDDDARDHLRRPALWIEPRNTSVNPRRPGVMARATIFGRLK